MPRSRRLSCSAFAIGGLVVLLVGGLAVVANSNWFAKKIGGSWDITYEGTGGRAGTGQASDVRYAYSPDRTGSEPREETTGPVGLPWSRAVFVGVGDRARVEVHPAGNGTAACRILLDGVRVVAEGTSPAPGKPAVCEVTTSSTPGKWPR